MSPKPGLLQGVFRIERDSASTEAKVIGTPWPGEGTGVPLAPEPHDAGQALVSARDPIACLVPSGAKHAGSAAERVEFA